MSGQWISDGSPEIIISTDVSEVECNPGEHYGNVFNAIWKESEEGVSSGSHYWQIYLNELQESSIFVGLTDNEKFKRGWSLRGLFFGGPGNLSNGGSLIKGGFGPAMKTDTTIGVLAIFEEDKLKVYFDVDGKPLGLAFDLQATVLNGIFPAVHFSGKGKATISKNSEIPSDLSLQEETYEGIEGKWKCMEFKGETQRKCVTVDISKSEAEENSYNIHLRVINGIGFGLKLEDGKWKTSGGMSTLMGGMPEDMQLEGDMSNLFHTLSKTEVEGSALVVANETIDSKWDRYTVSRLPVTENPFK